MANFLRIGKIVLNLDQVIGIKLDVKINNGSVRQGQSMVVVYMACASGDKDDIQPSCRSFYDEDAEKLRAVFTGNFSLRQSKDFDPVAQMIDLNTPVTDVVREEAIES